MNIRQKLLYTVVATSVIVAVLGFLLIYQLGKITDQFEETGPLDESVAERIQDLDHAATLDKLALSIRYYDEVLTQSARNYAFTGDEQWQTRYRSAEPELDAIIKEAISEGGDAESAFFSTVDEANQALIKLEYRSIELVNLQRNAEAVSILESKEYWDYKAIYKDALDEYIAARGENFLEVSDTATNSIVEANSLEEQNFQHLSMIYTTLIFAIPILIAVVVVVGFQIANSISTPIKRLISATDELGKGNYEAQLGRAENNETGILATRFDQMRRKLRERETIREDFLKVASHELRTPIQPILSYVEMARKNIINKDKALDEIYIQARRLTKLATDLLDASKIESGSLPYQMRMINYNELIENAVSAATIRIQNANRQVIVETDLVSSAGLIINADPERIMQVFTNILNNAIKFTDKGTIKVSTNVDNASKEIHVEIQDSGIGIPEKMMPRLFEKFATSSSAEGNQGGTGLGLHLAAKIIEAHKGKIWGKNNVGDIGSTFGFSLPFASDVNSPDSTDGGIGHLENSKPLSQIESGI